MNVWLASADTQNRELLLARSQARIAAAQVDLARARKQPTLSLNASASARSSDNEQAVEGEQANMNLALELPIYTGGQLNAQIHQDALRHRQAIEQVQATEQNIERQTRRAYRQVIASVSEVDALIQALASTKQAGDAVRAGFDTGTRTTVELLNAERNVFRAQADYASAHYRYLINLLRLKQLAGVLQKQDVKLLNDALG